MGYKFKPRLLTQVKIFWLNNVRLSRLGNPGSVLLAPGIQHWVHHCNPFSLEHRWRDNNGQSNGASGILLCHRLEVLNWCFQWKFGTEYSNTDKSGFFETPLFRKNQWFETPHLVSRLKVVFQSVSNTKSSDSNVEIPLLVIQTHNDKQLVFRNPNFKMNRCFETPN
jgi:hypothetical protein